MFKDLYLKNKGIIDYQLVIEYNDVIKFWTYAVNKCPLHILKNIL